MYTVTITSQGQITIPAAVRRAMGLRAGDELSLSVSADHNSANLRKVMTLDELTDFAMSKINTTAKPLTDANAYYQQHRQEKIR